MMNTKKTDPRVLVIYTGGTIGSKAKDPSDPASPQVVVSTEEFEESLTQSIEAEWPIKLEKIEKPVDSCDVGPTQWQEMADLIERYYHQVEGFVILHGTDTMVYTASALSFMLVNLAKPVIITGAQTSHMVSARNDALQNIVSSLMIADPNRFSLPVLPEVAIMFGQDLFRGNRSRKRDANGYAAYESPKYSKLAKIGANIEIFESRIRSMPTQDFYVRRNLDPSVILFDVFPGVHEGGIASRILNDEDLKGVIVKAYGAGNIPTEPKFLGQFKTAIEENDVFVSVVTQCTEGRVELGLYETSNKLLELGMASGVDLTPEAALCKLMVGLGDDDLKNDPLALRAYMQSNQAGEQSTTIIEYKYDQRKKPSGQIDAEEPVFRFSSSRPLGGNWSKETIELAALRLHGAKIEAPSSWPKSFDRAKVTDKTPVSAIFQLYLKQESAPPERLDTIAVEEGTKYAGEFIRRSTADKPDGDLLTFDITKTAKRLLSPNENAPITAFFKSPSGKISWDAAELVLFLKE